ncbi:MAG: hypothetical protein EBQ92_09570, partial [Proteobacteria bacterium]|nr:hypothetical protein [Pseudomonadota bacterium]
MPMAHNNVLRALGFLLMMSSISWAGAVRDSFPDNCDGLDSVACSELVREMRKKLQGNTPKSFGVYRDACKQGDSIGCVSLAGAVAVKETTDARKAEHIVSAEQIKNLNESCFKNDTESCLALAVAYYYGFGGRKEFEKSNELATK